MMKFGSNAEDRLHLVSQKIEIWSSRRFFLRMWRAAGSQTTKLCIFNVPSYSIKKGQSHRTRASSCRSASRNMDPNKIGSFRRGAHVQVSWLLHIQLMFTRHASTYKPVQILQIYLEDQRLSCRRESSFSVLRAKCVAEESRSYAEDTHYLMSQWAETMGLN